MRVSLYISLAVAVLFSLSSAPYAGEMACGGCCAGKAETHCGEKSCQHELAPASAENCCEVGQGGESRLTITNSRTDDLPFKALIPSSASPLFAGNAEKRISHNRLPDFRPPPIYLLNAALLC